MKNASSVSPPPYAPPHCWRAAGAASAAKTAGTTPPKPPRRRATPITTASRAVVDSGLVPENAAEAATDETAQKIIYNASLSMESTDFDTTREA